jgi:type IV secretory pathway VirB3-like protein
MSIEEKDEYASYNSMSREPLIAGIPIIPLISLLGLAAVTAALGFIFLGVLKGLIVPTIILAGLFVIRVKCMDDSRAMKSIFWDLKGIFYRLSSGSLIVSFTSISNSDQRRKENVIEWFKNNPDTR